jgi:hypothetical protein
MNQKNDERMQQEKRLKNAAGRPHLLIFAEKTSLKSGGTEEGLIMIQYDLGKLQFALASNSDEDELQGLINFFTEALERHRKTHSGIKAEVIPLNDKE